MFTLSLALTFFACDGNTQNSHSSTGQVPDQINGSVTKTTELTVWGMTCNRCANNIKNTVMALDGVIDVSVDLQAEKVTVQHEPTLDTGEIERAITAAGYNIP